MMNFIFSPLIVYFSPKYNWVKNGSKAVLAPVWYSISSCVGADPYAWVNDNYFDLFAIYFSQTNPSIDLLNAIRICFQ